MVRKWWVLLIEHDEGYQQVFASAVKDSALDVELFSVRDSFAAMEYLRCNELCSDLTKFPYPDLVFVDLAIPSVNGFISLKQMRQQLRLQNVPVVVLSNPDAKRDVAAAYAWLASAVHKRPSRYEDLVALLRTVVPLWLDWPKMAEMNPWG